MQPEQTSAPPVVVTHNFMKTGDIVQLKSGGPKMTVAKIDEFVGHRGRQMALCTWFDKDEKPQEKLFDPIQLKIVEE